MTLILSCLTNDYAIQVSDRRLTLNGNVFEDNENKVVDWGGQIAFGYTGLARILSKPTDHWLCEALLNDFSPQGTLSLNSILEKVRLKATNDFKKLFIKDKRLTIIGIGWVQVFHESDPKPAFSLQETKPALCWISNSMDDEGNYLSTPNDEFKANLSIFDKLPNEYFIVGIGQHVNEERSKNLKRNLERFPSRLLKNHYT